MGFVGGNVGLLPWCQQLTRKRRTVESVPIEQTGCVAWPWKVEGLIPSARHTVCMVLLYSGDDFKGCS
jgi:hypothetical protein